MLKDFLVECKSKLDLQGPLKVCIGSMACDPDSFCCSLVLSYEYKLIPLINMPRVVFESKGELMYVCEKIGVKPEELIFVENENLVYNVTRKEIKHMDLVLYLVDENDPGKVFQNFKIEMIVDHHEFFHNYENNVRIEKDLSAKSCASIVSQIVNVEKEIRKILLYPIVYDTNNLKQCSNIDKIQYDFICRENSISDTKSILEDMKQRSYDQDNQSCYTLLRKDYKEYDNFGISTVKLSPSHLININGVTHFKNEVKQFMTKENIEYYFINSKSENDNRYLMVFPETFPYTQRLLNEIPSAEKKLDLEKQGIHYYVIDSAFNRKKITPVIRRILSLIKHI